QLENLIRAGAFDTLDPNRARLFAAAETILRRAQAEAAEAESGQAALFGGGARPEALRLPETPDWPPLERLGFEAEAVGFHLTAHPLDAYAQALRRLRVVALAQLEARAQAGESRVKLAGTVVAVKERTTRTGNRMAFVRLSDATGSTEVTLFSEVLGGARPLLAAGTNLLIAAELQTQGETLRATALEVSALERAVGTVGAGLRVWLAETAAVAHIRTLLGAQSSGRGRVFLIPRTDEARSVEIALPGGFSVTPMLAQAMAQLPGVERVEEV
ncbi:MAG: DNA polymerase III subunit alpha, partial [Rhodospirillales bacterium]|nr:DNA polymerase III subunit alpha [Rhodospirillales bacterium]